MPNEKQFTREEVLAMAREDGFALAYVDQAWCADREIALAAVSNCGEALQFLPEPLRSDWEIVRTAMNNDPDVLDYAGEAFLACRERFMNGEETCCKR